MANYAASSVARKAANDVSMTAAGAGTPVNLIVYRQKVGNLLVAGMELDPEGLRGCIDRDPAAPTAELSVAVRTKLQAWPFFGDILHTAFQSTYDAPPLLCPDLATTGSFGPFNFSAQAPYYWYVTGRARVRLNYAP